MKKAFTLIELLVVIAIIAILAAILFPVFAQAKAAAKKTAAISNAKQIGTGELMYQNDYDDQYVLYFTGYDPVHYAYTSPLYYWTQTISPYISKAQAEQGLTQTLIQDLSPVFIDPIKGSTQQNPTLWATGNISSWGYSDDIANWYAPHGVNATYLGTNASSVVAPSGTLIFTETWDYYSPQHNLAGCAFARSYFDNNTSTINGAMRFLDSPYNAKYKKTASLTEPDPSGFNVTIFCDTHAKAMVTGQLTHSGQYWSIGANNQWP